MSGTTLCTGASCCALLALATVLAGCAECTQVLLAKGDLSNLRPPYGAWQPAANVRLDPANPSLFDIVPGTGVIVNGSGGKTVDLLTAVDYGDLRVSYEFCVSEDSNAGLYFMGRYKLQLSDSYGASTLTYADCGGLYEGSKAEPAFDGRPPRVNACKPPGEWQTVEVLFRAPRFDESGRKIENARFERVSLNRVLIHEDVELAGPTREAHFDDEQPFGPLIAQGAGGPIAFRNLRVTPMHLP
jgi:hypothetical protein